MYDVELDKTMLKSAIGPNVYYIELAELIKEYRAIECKVSEELGTEIMGKYKVEGPTSNDINNACSLALAMVKIVEARVQR